MNYSIGSYKGIRGRDCPGFDITLLDANGKKVARVADYGDGSICLSWEFLGKTNEQRLKDAREIEAYAKTLDLKYVIGVDGHADAMVNRLVHLHLTKKDITKHMKKGAVMFDKAKKQYAIFNTPQSAVASYASLQSKYPNMVLLNTMDLDAAARLVSEASE